MEPLSSLPGSPGGPLNPLSPDRANQQRDSVLMASIRSDLRDSSVHDKISQFNSLAMQSKSLERKTADAALKRAMLGREEAETEMRRFREENKVLRAQLDKARDREQRVSERLETVMEQYGRAKETHAHTKAAWEKEIKMARKKTFKNDATVIRLQEELKAARDGWRAVSDHLDNEKARSKVREQEAFEARYQMVGLEEQLEKALEQAKLLEQERDAFKNLAKEEEVARIAAEGRIPLPKADEQDDEFASPKKSSKPRASLSTADIISSAASEEEIEQLTREVRWERQRADRAHELIDFLQAECHLRVCEASKYLRQHSQLATHRNPEVTEDLPRAGEVVVLEDVPVPSSPHETSQSPPLTAADNSIFKKPALPAVKNNKNSLRRDESRRSTIFCAKEGIFRTVSEAEMAVMEAANEDKENQDNADAQEVPNSEAEDHVELPEADQRLYARTPSVEPPSFALLAQERTSLASLLNAPHGGAHTAPLPSIPTVSDSNAEADASDETQDENQEALRQIRPHTTAAHYQTTTTTTIIPVREDKARPVPRYERSRTPSSEGQASFDVNNPAMTPTMSREEALARIRERRGRARSAAQGAPTPKRKATEGTGERRDMSAPTSSAGAPASIKRAAHKVRSAR